MIPALPNAACIVTLVERLLHRSELLAIEALQRELEPGIVARAEDVPAPKAPPSDVGALVVHDVIRQVVLRADRRKKGFDDLLVLGSLRAETSAGCLP
jgi:hypothetical protein